MTTCVEATLTGTEKKIFISTTDLRRWELGTTDFILTGRWVFKKGNCAECVAWRRWLWPLIGALSALVVSLGVIMWLVPLFIY